VACKTAEGKTKMNANDWAASYATCALLFLVGLPLLSNVSSCGGGCDNSTLNRSVTNRAASKKKNMHAKHAMMYLARPNEGRTTDNPSDKTKTRVNVHVINALDVIA